MGLAEASHLTQQPIPYWSEHSDVMLFVAFFVGCVAAFFIIAYIEKSEEARQAKWNAAETLGHVLGKREIAMQMEEEYQQVQGREERDGDRSRKEAEPDGNRSE